VVSKWFATFVAQGYFLLNLQNKIQTFKFKLPYHPRQEKPNNLTVFWQGRVHSLSMLSVWKGFETSHHLGEERQNFLQYLVIVLCLSAISNASAATIPINNGLERWQKMFLDTWCQWLSIIISSLLSTRRSILETTGGSQNIQNWLHHSCSIVASNLH